jgi:hypothetical protein
LGERFVPEIPQSAFRAQTTVDDVDDSSGPIASDASAKAPEGSTRTLIEQRNKPRWWARRWFLATLGAVVLVVVVFLAATLRLIVFPTEDQPRHADAIVSFNGSNEGMREALAESLGKKGYAPVLLFSQGGSVADTWCPKVSGVSVVCFVDKSGNTRGEAEWVGRYADRHHWHTLLLVPGRGQATRARLLTGRCFSGQLVVVPAAEPRPPLSTILHEWGGLFDAVFVHRSC